MTGASVTGVETWERTKIYVQHTVKSENLIQKNEVCWKRKFAYSRKPGFCFPLCPGKDWTQTPCPSSSGTKHLNLWQRQKNKKNFRWIIKCQINCCTAKRCCYIWHWWGYALDPWSRPSPHRYEEDEALVEETLATVCCAGCRCTKPSAPVLGSPFLGTSSLSWRKICKTHESFIDRDITMFDPWERAGATYFFRMGIKGFRTVSKIFMRKEFPVREIRVLVSS